MSKKELKVKVHGTLEDVVSHLESIVASLKEGTIVIQNNNTFISLKPQDQVYLEIEAEQKKDKEELSLELSWRTSQLLSEGTASGLSISSKEPEIAEEPMDESETSTEGI